MRHVTPLETKVTAPRLRPDTITRPRLTARLDEGWRGSLVVVCAPAGFGKTTAVCQWLMSGSTQNAALAWLSLDATDRDPIRFLIYVLSAVRTIAPQFSDDMLALLQSSQPPPTEVVLTDLINEIAQASRDVVVVLDDFHTAESTEVDHVVEFLVERLPPQFHVVLVAREDPRLPLARWRAGGLLTEVRATDLRFTDAETIALFSAKTGLEIPDEDVLVLQERTEGWIAGLQLAALSLQHNPNTSDWVDRFAGSQRYVLDYLVEEVLQRQPENIRTFLLQTAILDRLCGDLCDVVTGQQHSTQMLEALERGNTLVVALDEQRRWYRYHHLFADVLRAQLGAEMPEQVPVLHQRASAWFEREHLPFEAIGHALSAGLADRAAALLERHGEEVENPERAGTWLTLARALPDDLIGQRPALAIWFAYALLGTGDLDGAVARMTEAEALLGESSGYDAESIAILRGRIAVGRAFVCASFGDPMRAVEQARRAMALLPASEQVRRDQATALLGMTYLTGGQLQEADTVFTTYGQLLLAAGNVADAIATTCLLADIRRLMGHLRLAEDALATLREAVSERGTPPPAELAELYRARAELLLTRGDLVGAGESLWRSGQFGQLRQMPMWRYRWHVAQARLRQAQGDRRAALDLLDEAQRLYIRTPMPDLVPVGAMRARIWVAQGRVADALSWAGERGLTANDDLDLLNEYEHLTLARILLADAAAAASASALLDRLLRCAEDGARMGTVIEVLVLQAIALKCLGDTQAAAASLHRALALAEAEGYVQVFIDEGGAMADLLREVADHDGAQGFARSLLAAFPQSGTALPGAPALSPREVEVLQLIAAGLTNQQIAARLYVSIYTVKAHARSIYDKLDAHSRTAAVARARTQGWLPPP